MPGCRETGARAISTPNCSPSQSTTEQFRSSERRFRIGWVAAVLLVITCKIRPAATAELPPSTVELVLVGSVQRERSLSYRVRSLFPAETRFTTDARAELDRDALLHPPTPGTLYLWITLNAESLARIYVAIRERHSENTRYLYRDVLLTSGLDEIGCETLAQVAHSSASALWARERQSPRQIVESAIEAESGEFITPFSQPSVPPASSTGSAASSQVPVAQAPTAPSKLPLQLAQGARAAETKSAPALSERPVGVILAAAYSTHASGGEGWLDQLGGSVSAVFIERFSARAAAAYLAPQQFELSFTRVRLTGFLAELRLGWKPKTAGNFRPHLEAGIGVLSTRWSADSVAPAAGQPGATQKRYFTLGAVGYEWAPSFVTVAARFELRVPFRDTEYYVVGSTDDSRSVHSWLNPGFAIELGFPLDPFF